jgi:hypothetical protein
VHFGECLDIVAEVAEKDVLAKLFQFLAGISGQPIFYDLGFGFHMDMPNEAQTQRKALSSYAASPCL